MPDALVAIHQPNFLPWPGYFDKLARADKFVLLDHVQFPKKGGTWMNRVEVLLGGRAAWLTAPVDRSFHGVRSISEMRFDDTTDWRAACLDRLRAGYHQADFFSEGFPLVEQILQAKTSSVAQFNERGVRSIAGALGIDAGKILRSSDLSPCGASTELLVDLVKKAGGSAYLAGGGAAGYQDDETFAAAGIRLVPQRFVQPEYPQPTEGFVPGLSIPDAFMHCGLERTRAIVKPEA